jgi:hypothetical protein
MRRFVQVVPCMVGDTEVDKTYIEIWKITCVQKCVAHSSEALLRNIQYKLTVLNFPLHKFSSTRAAAKLLENTARPRPFTIMSLMRRRRRRVVYFLKRWLWSHITLQLASLDARVSKGKHWCIKLFSSSFPSVFASEVDRKVWPKCLYPLLSLGNPVWYTHAATAYLCMSWMKKAPFAANTKQGKPCRAALVINKLPDWEKENIVAGCGGHFCSVVPDNMVVAKFKSDLVTEITGGKVGYFAAALFMSSLYFESGMCTCCLEKYKIPTMQCNGLFF